MCAADNRDLNYDKYFVKGQVHTQADESYTSHNTRRLNVEQTIQKIMTTDYIQEELAKDCASEHCDNGKPASSSPGPAALWARTWWPS